MNFQEDEIIKLCEVDSEIINKSFSVSEALGVAAIKDSIANYHNLLRSLKGDFVSSMDLDYRTYIINLLKITTETANEKNKAIIFSEIVIPS